MFKGQKFKNYLEVLIITIIVVGFGGGAVYLERYVSSEVPKSEKKDTKPTVSALQEKETKSVPVTQEDIINKQVTFSSNNPINEAHVLLDKYGWRMTEIVNIEETQIPTSFEDKEGEIPIGLYWAYCNELSKAMGLDFTKYKGEKIKQYVVSLSSKKSQGNHAVIIVNKDKIIGAWLLGKDMNTKTLDEKNFKEVVATAWENWLKENGFENYNSSFNQSLKKLTPQEIINKYFDSIAKKDYRSAFMLFSKYRQSDMITKAVRNELNDVSKYDFSSLPFYTVKQIKTYNINEDVIKDQNIIFYTSEIANRKEIESKRFTIQVEAKFGFEGETQEGYNRKVYVYMVRESKDAPWQIENIEW